MTNPDRPLTPDPPAPPGDDVAAPDIRFSRPDDQPETTDRERDTDDPSGTVPAEQDVNTDSVSPEPPD